jgi:glycosyltransferase involved in cell wall biosynthesis
MISNSPLVSICCVTYNHERFIRDCINGFLLQQVNFPVEFLIHDDASTDKTASILKEMVGDDPRFKLILRETNIKSTGVAVFPILYKQAKGKYIALCEGDDYWTDLLKLQKQVNFLENHSDYGLVYSDFTRFYVGHDKFVKGVRYKKRILEGDLFDVLLFFNPIATCTVLFRAFFVKSFIDGYSDNLRGKWKMGDKPLWLFIALNSKIGYLRDITSVQNILESSATNTNPFDKLKFIQSSYEISFYFLKKRFDLGLFFKLYFEYTKTITQAVLKYILSIFKLYGPKKERLVSRYENGDV